MNDFLREATGHDFTAKDFRTWNGTVAAAALLHVLGPPDSDAAAKKHVVAAIRDVAAQLGNTPAICRKSYVHPAVLDCYVTGRLHSVATEPAIEPDGLTADESALLALLRREAAGAPASTASAASAASSRRRSAD